MTEKPILFSGPLVRAILENRKTQTRRVIKPEWYRCLDLEDPQDIAKALGRCPYGHPGDQPWVRETWSVGTIYDALPRPLVCCRSSIPSQHRRTTPASQAHQIGLVATVDLPQVSERVPEVVRKQSGETRRP